MELKLQRVMSHSIWVLELNLPAETAVQSLTYILKENFWLTMNHNNNQHDTITPKVKVVIFVPWREPKQVSN